MKSEYIKECIDISKKLKCKATKIFWFYLIATSISVLLGLILLPDFFDNKFVNYTLGVIPVIFTFALIFFRDKIEKIEGYRELASEFQNLSRDLKKDGENRRNLLQLKQLTKQLSKYPVGGRN